MKRWWKVDSCLLCLGTVLVPAVPPRGSKKLTAVCGVLFLGTVP